MDFTIPEEYRMLQSLVKQYVEAELRPLEKQIEELQDIPDDIWARLIARSKELGLLAPFAPVEYGGGGVVGWLPHILMLEEVAKTSRCFGETVARGYENGRDLATPYQIENFYAPVWRGEQRLCSAITEPDAGSDQRAMKTMAVRRGDRWMINGQKCFVSRLDKAAWAMVYAVTDKERRRISSFIVPTSAPGVARGQRHKMMGEHGWNEFEVFFNDVQVPQQNLLGQEGMALRQFLHYIDLVRLRVAAYAIGACQYMVEQCVAYARDRHTFGKPIAARQAVQGMIVDSWMEMESLRWVTYYCCWAADNGQKTFGLPAACKIMGSETGCRVADRAIQVHGGSGYSGDLPFERIYRDMRGFKITDGANEVLKHLVIARELLGPYD
ncbi:MAG: acyl-CoA dehydrogenase family protein [Chloroflexota bacterium]